MMKLCKAFFLISIFCCAKTVAQNDSINRLEAVVLVADVYLQQDVIGQKKVSITEEEIQKNNTNPTEILRFNSPISIRDYGNGGTSSARFRGTSASNTAVLWNGININAIGNGQTGLNSLFIATSDEIVVKSGGGSVKYGSGAIGGSIHVNDYLQFKKHQNFKIASTYGSFNTSSNAVVANLGSEKWALKLSSTFNKSDNDYDLVDDRYKDSNGKYLKNENGAYQNYGINLSVGYQFSKDNTVSFYTTGYKGDRLFSGELPNPSAADEKYKDLNQRNLLVWDLSNSVFHHVLKGAFLTQEYRYFSNKESDTYDFGSSKTYLFKYDFRYRLSEKTSLTTFVDLQNIKGKTNKINLRTREQYALTLGVNSKITQKVKTTLEVKKEWNSAFKVPVVFSLGGDYSMYKQHHLLINISNNYRVPTLNDLYWPGQGNSLLIPETSKQIDFGYQFLNDLVTIKNTLFFMNIENKIIWTPNGNPDKPGVWIPINLNQSYHSGVETFVKLQKRIAAVKMDVIANYVYTVAKDNRTKKDLIFVPRHLFNGTFSLAYKNTNVYVQNLSQSKVYTSEDNIAELSLDGFMVFNVGAGIAVFSTKKSVLNIGMSVKNIFNQLYLFSNLRPMPGRNYNININYKF